MDQINRRKFLKSGAAGAAAIVVAGPVAGSSLVSRQDRKIIYRTLGRTGLKVPVVSMGVMRADNPGLVTACMENGINFFDTANGYQNGRNEEMLGTVLGAYPRDSFIITTKVKPAGVDRAGLPTAATTAASFEASFNTSLQRLKMDYVDILYVHDVSTTELVNYQPLLELLAKLKKQGKIRFSGISTHRNEPQVIELMIKNGQYDVVLTSYNFMQAYRDQVSEAVRKASEAGMGVVAMKTIAGGFLDRERTKPVNPSAALKWVLANPGLHTTIPGFTAFEHLQSVLPVLENITMTEQEKKDISVAETIAGLYCNGCQTCTASCPKNLPIPDIMRAYMYGYGYGSTLMAYNLLSEDGVGADPCGDCSICTAKCIKGFNIREKIADICRVVELPQEFLA
ncbi:MAG: aldo/keto reductase [Bacteroidales bacterium]|jgi:predicted aldo/keto reductase-like oxidoreductase|nr:aldo/keto reductase [Bacteroidales bacterium]